MSLGSLIKQHRVRKGITQQALADAVGVNHTYISKIEHDAMSRPPSEALIEKIAEQLFPCDPVELLLESGNTEFRGLREKAAAHRDLQVILRFIERQPSSEYEKIWKALMTTVVKWKFVEFK